MRKCSLHNSHYNSVCKAGKFSHIKTGNLAATTCKCAPVFMILPDLWPSLLAPNHKADKDSAVTTRRQLSSVKAVCLYMHKQLEIQIHMYELQIQFLMQIELDRQMQLELQTQSDIQLNKLLYFKIQLQMQIIVFTFFLLQFMLVALILASCLLSETRAYCSLDKMRAFAMEACERLFQQDEPRERRSIGYNEHHKNKLSRKY